jgi:hypothetical protein
MWADRRHTSPSPVPTSSEASVLLAALKLLAGDTKLRLKNPHGIRPPTLDVVETEDPSRLAMGRVIQEDVSAGEIARYGAW